MRCRLPERRGESLGPLSDSHLALAHPLLRKELQTGFTEIPRSLHRFDVGRRMPATKIAKAAELAGVLYRIDDDSC